MEVYDKIIANFNRRTQQDSLSVVQSEFRWSYSKHLTGNQFLSKSGVTNPHAVVSKLSEIGW